MPLRLDERWEVGELSVGTLSVACESFTVKLRAALRARAYGHHRICEEHGATVTTFSLEFPRGERRRALDLMAVAISDTVMDHWEPRFVEALLENRFPALLGNGGQFLPRGLRNLLAPEDDVDSRWLSRRQMIYEEVRDYLDDAEGVILEGFLSFRLREYRASLERAIDHGAFSWIGGAPDEGPGIDDEEMDLVFRADGTVFLADTAGTVLLRGSPQDDGLANLILRYLLTHRVPAVTVHDPADCWEYWEGADVLPAVVEDIDACFGCALCLGARSSR
ncbi:MAG: sporulation protein YtxC [Clostridia bacterium]